jgi:hypothetical protein
MLGRKIALWKEEGKWPDGVDDKADVKGREACRLAAQEEIGRWYGKEGNVPGNGRAKIERCQKSENAPKCTSRPSVT